MAPQKPDEPFYLGVDFGTTNTVVSVCDDADTTRVLRMSTAETDAFVKSEIKKWSTLIRVAGITAE